MNGGESIGRSWGLNELLLRWADSSIGKRPRNTMESFFPGGDIKFERSEISSWASHRVREGLPATRKVETS